MGSKEVVLLLVAAAAASTASAQQQDCLVTENGSGETKPCAFPFVFRGVRHGECTDEGDAQGRKWCSTRTKNDGSDEHVGGGGYWGLCPDDCGGGGEDSNREVDEAIADVEAYGLRTGSGDLDSCPCAPYQNCPVVARLIDIGNGLPRGHSRRERIRQALRQVICQGGRRGYFHCCSAGQSNQAAVTTPTTTKIETAVTTPAAVVDDDPELGTWKPKIGSCGTNALSENIVGGVVAKLGEFPFIVLLGYEIRGRIYYTCGASLINKHYVLTAAHCITGDYDVAELLLGEHDLGNHECACGSRTCDCRDCDSKRCNPPPVKRKPAEIVVHEDWDQRRFTEGNDIALIRMDRPVDLFFDDGVESILSPVCLAWDSNSRARDIAAGSKTTVVGWGKVTNNRTESRINYNQFSAATRQLNKLDLFVQEDDDCAADFSRFNSRLQLCSGGEVGKDSCSGDSGGPLVYRSIQTRNRWHQVGVVSYGTTSCGRGKPGVYTKVANYLDWIEENLKP